MKRIVCLLIVFTLIPFVCFADFVTVQVYDEIVSGKTGETIDSQLIDREWTDGDEIIVSSHIDTTSGEYTLKRVIVNGELAVSSNQVVLPYADYRGVSMITVEFMYKKVELPPVVTDEPPTITDEPPTETDPPVEPTETIETDPPVVTTTDAPTDTPTDVPTDLPTSQTIQEQVITDEPTEKPVEKVEIVNESPTDIPVSAPVTDSPVTDSPVLPSVVSEPVVYFDNGLIVEEIIETPTPAPKKSKKKSKKATPTPKPKKTPRPAIKQYNIGILDKNLNSILDQIDISMFDNQKTLIWVDKAELYLSIELR